MRAIRRLKRHLKHHKPIAFIALFALVGGSLILLTRAAGPYVALEPENATITSPATKVNDATASGGSYVKFGAATVTPPTDGAMPTKDNTGPRYSMTSMTADQFLDSGVCNRQRITQRVEINGNYQGKHFVLNDCELAGGLGVYTQGGGSVPPLNQMASIEANYVDFGGGGISLVNPLSSFKMTHSWNDGGQWAIVDNTCDTNINVNGTNYDIQDSIFERALNGDPSEHLEGLHTCGFVDNQKFTNTKFLVSGSGISPVTGTINFHGKNSLFDHCYFVFDVSPPYNITWNVYIEGANNKVQNSFFSSLGGKVYPNSSPMATYTGNKNYDTGAPLTLP